MSAKFAAQSLVTAGVMLLLTQTSAAQANNCPVCYFGYYWGAGSQNYMGQFADHSNMVHIIEENAAKLEAKLVEARQRGMMGILTLQYLLFSAKGTLRADYRARWDAFADTIDPYVDDVLAFYPVDEPLWFDNACHHDATTRQMYETVNAMVKARFPRKPIIATFAYPCVTSQLTIPAGYDWISFDRYGTFSPIPGYLNLIKSKLRAGQKVFLTPDGFSSAAAGAPSSTAQAAWVTRADQYNDLARSDPTVIGLWTFLWPSSHVGTGVSDMPLVQAAYRRIGTKALGCNPPAGTCCVRAECDDGDDATRDACDVLTGTCSNTRIIVPDAAVVDPDAGIPDGAGGGEDLTSLDGADGADGGVLRDAAAARDGGGDGGRFGDASVDALGGGGRVANGGCDYATDASSGSVPALIVFGLLLFGVLRSKRRRGVVGSEHRSFP